MPSLSVVMIVKNEAHCLADCLRSAQSIASEIVIGDTGSTDATADVARSFGAVVHDVPWHDDFAEARNAVLARANGEWLLHLDADEVVDPAGANRIREIIDGDGFGADAIEVTLANYCDDPRAWRWTPCDPSDPAARGFSGYIGVGLLRLFRNRRGFEYREPVHENITESVVERGGVIRAEPILIHHYCYSPPQIAAESKKRFYLEIARKKAAQRANDPKAWHDLAEQLLACGDASQAEKACRTALSLDPAHLGAITTLANLLLNRGELVEAQALLERARMNQAAPAHVLTALGAIAVRQGHFDEARGLLEAALASEPKAVMAALYLARAYDLLGWTDLSRNLLHRFTKIVPLLKEITDRVESHRLRQEAEKLFQDGNAEQALERLIEALRLDADDPITHNDLGVVALSLGDQARARRSFEWALLLAAGFAPAKENLEGIT
ncbi:MAG: glycosyltransferase [Candidatus Hydrogenedentes bacterium]|nr:glycosyltransferase [Candidatus Hydrogenedentota bacterium]